MSNATVSHISKWFIAIKLALNIGKRQTIKFVKNNSPQHALCAGCNGR
jgi:hypothetical protein